MAAQAQLIYTPLTLPPPPIALPTLPPTYPGPGRRGGSQLVDPSDKEGGGGRLEGEG